MLKLEKLTIIVVLLNSYETDNLIFTQLAFILFEIISTRKNVKKIGQDSPAKQILFHKLVPHRILLISIWVPVYFITDIQFFSGLNFPVVTAPC